MFDDTLINTQQAAGLISKGSVIAYPTEAVYGLGCDPHCEQAVRHILKLKDRPLKKGLILIASEIRHFYPWIDAETFNAFPHIKTSWQQNNQAITWILPCRPETPIWLTGEFNTLAVRISHNSSVQALCEVLDSAIVSTSANPTGSQESRTAQQVSHYFPKTPILEGELSGFSMPSTIKDAVSGATLRK